MKLFRTLTFFLAVLLASAQVRAGDVIYSCAGEEKRIALTFDDGPHPVHTREILDILAEYGVRATFFVVGENAERYPELLEAEARAGHEIGNHSYTHTNLRQANGTTVAREIDEGERAIYEIFEYRTRLLRPPGGCVGKELLEEAEARDYRIVCWSVDTRDWAHTPVKQITEKVLREASGGDILLFHDYIAGDSPTPEALRAVIPKLLKEGYQFVTVSELIGIR